MADLEENIICRSGIYCIRNLVSGRVYVGSAINIEQRWYSHRSLLLKGKHHSPTLMRSWLKHGSAAFSFEILESVPNVSKLIEREQFWIDRLSACCPKRGFNISPTAGSPLGVKHSTEVRRRRSEAMKGKRKSPEGARAIGRATSLRNQSEEMRRKVSVSKKAFYSTPEGKEAARQMAQKFWDRVRATGAVLSRRHTPETKLKLSLAKKGKMTDAHKAAIAESNRRRALSRRT